MRDFAAFAHVRRAVLYSEQDMEPLTVITLPSDWSRFATEQRGVFQVPVLSRLPPTPPALGPEPPTVAVSCPTVIITCWPIYRDSREPWHVVFTVSDDSGALQLEATVLPGQRHDLNLALRNAFVRGVVTMLLRQLGA